MGPCLKVPKGPCQRLLPLQWEPKGTFSAGISKGSLARATPAGHRGLLRLAWVVGRRKFAGDEEPLLGGGSAGCLGTEGAEGSTS